MPRRLISSIQNPKEESETTESFWTPSNLTKEESGTTENVWTPSNSTTSFIWIP